jgi:apolipoprotein N-acyltransferase
MSQDKAKQSYSVSARVMITSWMLGMAFGSAIFIWLGISFWYDPTLSITSIGLGIFLILMSVAHVVRKELEHGGQTTGVRKTRRIE